MMYIYNIKRLAPPESSAACSTRVFSDANLRPSLSALGRSRPKSHLCNDIYVHHLRSIESSGWAILLYTYSTLQLEYILRAAANLQIVYRIEIVQLARSNYSTQSWRRTSSLLIYTKLSQLPPTPGVSCFLSYVLSACVELTRKEWLLHLDRKYHVNLAQRTPMSV
jgi:hypothetical protein